LDKHVTIAEEGRKRYSLSHVPSGHPADDTATQCDEARPICRPCREGRLTCEYEFPVGRTRAQALLESQHHLRAKLHSHASMISTLRQVGLEASIQLLGPLRRGDYDRALLGNNSASRMTAFGDTVYPWEDSLDEWQTHLEPSADILPSTDTLLPMHNSSAAYPISRPMVEAPGRSYEQDPWFCTYSAPWAPPLGPQSVRLSTNLVNMPNYDHRNSVTTKLAGRDLQQPVPNSHILPLLSS
jgi:hypothetical protein